MNEDIHQLLFSELEKFKSDPVGREGNFLPIKLGNICTEEFKRSPEVGRELTSVANLLGSLKGKVILDVRYTAIRDSETNPDGTLGTYYLYVQNHV
jgi:hypothetical protein